MKRLGLLALLLVGCAVVGCATPLRPYEFVPPQMIPRSFKPTDAPAVVLLAEDHFSLKYPSPSDLHHEDQHHEQILILAEAGLQQAEVRIFIPHGAWLKQFGARTISPSGEVWTVDAAAVHSVEHRDLKRDWTGELRTFRFPRVEVGSVIEYAYTTSASGWPHAVERRIGRELPIEHYRVDLTLCEEARFDVRLFNAPQAKVLRKELKGDQYQVSYQVDDVRAAPDEPFADPYERREAWWALLITRMNFHDGFVAGLDNWASAVRPWASALLINKRKLFAGFKGRIAKDGCAGAPCLVERALGWAREKAEFTGFHGWRLRPLDEVVRSGVANNFEKAALVYRLLSQAGLQVRYAAVSRDAAQPIDRTFPLPSLLDHLILYLPSQTGLSEPMFVDPSCESCAPGQLPSWAQESEAVVFESEPPFFGIAVAVRTITGQPAGTNRATKSYEATLEAATGDLTVVEDALALGTVAVGWRSISREVGEQKWRQQSEKTLKEHASTARFADASLPTCDRAVPRCSYTLRYSLPAYATADAKELRVPLMLWDSTWDRGLPHERRSGDDLVVRLKESTEDVLRLRLPPGFRVAALPPARTIDLDGGLRVEQSTSVVGDLISVRRSLFIAKGRFKPAAYDEVRDAIQAFADFRRDSILLRAK